MARVFPASSTEGGSLVYLGPPIPLFYCKLLILKYLASALIWLFHCKLCLALEGILLQHVKDLKIDCSSNLFIWNYLKETGEKLGSLWKLSGGSLPGTLQCAQAGTEGYGHSGKTSKGRQSISSGST